MGLTFSSLLILFGLMTACASGRNLSLLPSEAATLTPTPFQPQSGAPDSPFSAPAQSQPIATNTPVPSMIAKQNELIPAEVVPPVAGIQPEVINPLTGLPFADPALAERRPMAVKVANSPDYVRPQSGLSLADVVYEYYIEWGDTRFIAVFYGNDAEKVGPVRSGRYFDEHVLRMYHAFLVYKYSDPREKAYFYSSDFADFLTVPGYVGLNSCPPFFYAPSHDSYNNIFFNTAKFAVCAAKRTNVDNLKQDLRSGFFSEQPQPTDQTGTHIYTDYSIYNYNYWEYDPATHKYFRYQEATDMVKDQPRSYTPLSDAATGLPVTADNVVVVLAPHTFTNQYDQEDQVYHIDPVDGGQAFVFRDGLAYPARWYRTDMDQQMLIVNDLGIPIYMRPGHTFYQMIGESSLYSHEGENWFFNFQIP